MAAKASSEHEPWYAVRSLFFNDENGCYEERTIIVKAMSHSQAIEIAEKEAIEYCNDLDGVKYLSYSDSFHMFEEKIGNGAEVFSLIRQTDMSRDEYIDRFLESGFENRSDDDL